jgi:hypothetical protein
MNRTAPTQADFLTNHDIKVWHAQAKDGEVPIEWGRVLDKVTAENMPKVLDLLTQVLDLVIASQRAETGACVNCQEITHEVHSGGSVFCHTRCQAEIDTAA